MSKGIYKCHFICENFYLIIRKNLASYLRTNLKIKNLTISKNLFLVGWLLMAIATVAKALPTLPRWEISHGPRYTNWEQTYDPDADFYAEYYDYSYQEVMRDPSTGKIHDCRSSPMLCYELARIPKKLRSPTKTDSAIFSQIVSTPPTTTHFWGTASIPSIVIELVSFDINIM